MSIHIQLDSLPHTNWFADTREGWDGEHDPSGGGFSLGSASPFFVFFFLLGPRYPQMFQSLEILLFRFSFAFYHQVYLDLRLCCLCRLGLPYSST